MVVIAAGIRPNVDLAVARGPGRRARHRRRRRPRVRGRAGRLRDRRVRRASRPRVRAGRAAVGTGAGARRSVDRTKPRRAVPGLEHVDEAEGRRRRRRGDGRQGSGRGRRRGRQLRGAVARRLQEADRPQQPARRRHRHGRRRDRAVAPARVQRIDAAAGQPRRAAVPAAAMDGAPNGGRDSRHGADLRLQRGHEGADRRGGARRRAHAAGGQRRDARVHRLRLVQARGPGDRGTGVPGRRRREVLAERRRRGASRPVALPPDGDVVVTLNKIERYKKEKDGLDIVEDVPRLAQERVAGDRGRRPRAAEVGRRVLPPADARASS